MPGHVGAVALLVAAAAATALYTAGRSPTTSNVVTGVPEVLGPIPLTQAAEALASAPSGKAGGASVVRPSDSL